MLNINFAELDDVMFRLASTIQIGSSVSQFEAYARLLECKITALTENENY